MRTTIVVIVSIAALGLAAACKAQEPTASPHGQPAPAGSKDAPAVFDAPQPVGTVAKCPVLGNTFTIAADTAHSEYKGKHVYFCCPGCKPQFDAAPEKYLAAPGKP
jgi:YHS domain-containing protein